MATTWNEKSTCWKLMELRIVNDAFYGNVDPRKEYLCLLKILHRQLIPYDNPSHFGAHDQRHFETIVTADS